MQMLREPSRGGEFSVWADWKPPAAPAKLWPEMVALLASA